MKNIIYLLIFMNIFSCKSKIDEMEIIAYDTNEFEQFEKNATIKKEKAWELQLNYFQEKNKEISGTLFFIVDNNYLFSTSYNPKIPEASLTGLYVNSETGETFFLENSTKMQTASQFGWKGADSH